MGGVAAHLAAGGANHVEDAMVDRIHAKKVIDAVHAFVDALEEPETTMFKGHFLEGGYVADVARALEMAPRTVERALKNLRDRLREHLLRTVQL